MNIINLIKKLKKINVIETLVGDFYFTRNIGEGGNSNVCEFRKNNLPFAVKFFSKGTESISKSLRFKDEYFGIAQIPSHPNIAEYFHLDTVCLDGERYIIIIMKLYKSTLKGSLKDVTEKSDYINNLEGLFNDLLNAIKHLHANGIIHRDIKPQNILIDDKTGNYVLSDFGISKFDSDLFAKESQTKNGERLANYRYCAPEQRGKNISISFSSDLYSFGQVIQEYATGDINHGGGRTNVKFLDVESLYIIDKVIERCLMHNPDARFENVYELEKFMIEQTSSYKEKKRYIEQENKIDDQWSYLYNLNNAVAKGFPTINKIGEITDPIRMIRFLENIDETIESEKNKNSLWMIQSNGSDLNYYGAKHIRGNEFEINYGGFTHQARISKIMVHYTDTSPYANYFIILIDAMAHFEYCDTTNLTTKKDRVALPAEIDEAFEWNDYILDPQDTQNSYVEIEGTVYENKRDSFRRICRFIAPEALFVSPTGVFTNDAKQHDHAQTLLKACIKDNSLRVDTHSKYWDKVVGRYSYWISIRR